MTGLQLPGVIDELCFHDGPLGARVSDEGTSIDVWAPTAQQVSCASFAPYRYDGKPCLYHERAY